jgi:hypothetical protein
VAAPAVGLAAVVAADSRFVFLQLES